MKITNWILCSLVLITLSHSGKSTESNSPPGPVPMNVMSFNIRYGLADDGANSWDFRKGQVMEVIREYSPDIIGLQEALQFQLDAICESFPEYGRIGIGRDPGGEGEYAAILYRRKRFDIDQAETFWLSETPEIPSTHWGNRHLRICTWARLLDRTSGNCFYVYNTHFDHQSQPAREQSSRLLSKVISARQPRDPVVLMGDFNAGEDNPAILHLVENGPIDLKDSFRKVHPDVTRVGTFNGFNGKVDGEKIDYVFVDSGFMVLDAEIIRFNRDGRYPSDHFPVKARLQMETEGIAQGSKRVP